MEGKDTLIKMITLATVMTEEERQLVLSYAEGMVAVKEYYEAKQAS